MPGPSVEPCLETTPCTGKSRGWWLSVAAVMCIAATTLNALRKRLPLHSRVEQEHGRPWPPGWPDGEVDDPQVGVLAERETRSPVEAVCSCRDRRDGAARGHTDDGALRDDAGPDVPVHVERDAVDCEQRGILGEDRRRARASIRVDRDAQEPRLFGVADDELVLSIGDPVRTERE